jgi:Flp pilus assembly protein TadB
MTGTIPSGLIAASAALLVLILAVPVRPQPRRSPEVAPPEPETPPRIDRDRDTHRFPIVAARTLAAFRRRDRWPQPRDVAAWCNDLARELRSGSTLRHTLMTVGPDDDATRERTASLRLAVERSRPIGAAVAGVRHPGPHLGLALAVIVAAADVGGSAAEPLDRVAGALRQRAADHDERGIHAAQARLSAHVMTAVPLLMLAFLTVFDDDVRAVLTRPVGVACVGIGLALNAVGWFWMRRVVASDGAARSPSRRRRTQWEIERTWPDAVESMVHAVGAGLTPRQAVEQLAASGPGPVRGAFAAVVHRTERGQPLADALRALTDVLGPRAAGVADVIGTGDRYGLPLAPALDQLSRDARDARRRLDQAAARRLPVRLSFPLVACTLPSFVLLAIAPAVIAALSSLGGTAW